MCHGHLIDQLITNYKSFDHSGAMLWGIKEKSSSFRHKKSSSFCAPQKRALQSFICNTTYYSSYFKTLMALLWKNKTVFQSKVVIKQVSKLFLNWVKFLVLGPTNHLDLWNQKKCSPIVIMNHPTKFQVSRS